MKKVLKKMPNMITHKQALSEIFETEMLPEGKLVDHCDGILMSAGSDIPEDYYNFITLGDFYATDVLKGNLRDKYMSISQDVLCVSLRIDELENEAKSEYRAWVLSKLVRTVLINNKKLVSDSFPNGIATTTVLYGSPVESVTYWEHVAHVATITVEIKMKEEDE